jgi:hypothetical protein
MRASAMPSSGAGRQGCRDDAPHGRVDEVLRCLVK